MISIKRKDSHNFEDCHKYDYTINDGFKCINFYQIGSGDLIMVFSFLDDSNSMNISKKDYLLYKAIDKLYNNIITLDWYREKRKNWYSFYENETWEEIDKCYGQRLLNSIYDGKSIIWKSDAPIEDNTKLYNYLKISKEEDSYELSFTSDCNKKRIIVEFNTDRSRYEILVCEFIILLNDLKEITEPYRQITLDEYMNENKQKKR